MTLPTDEQRQLHRAYSQSYATEANRRSIAFWVDAVFAGIATAIATLKALDTATTVLEFLLAWAPPAALLWLVSEASVGGLGGRAE